MSEAKAHRLKIRLFLEGIEVPVIAAQVSTQPNSPAVASIQIPPLPEGTKFLPRTLVHLFFYDYYETSNPLIHYRGDSQALVSDLPPSVYEQTLVKGDDPVNITDSEEDSADLRNERYKLMFCGEVVGFQWTKGEGQRALVLQCADLSNYWDYAYQWNNTDLFGPGYKALFSGGATNLFTDFLEDEGSAILRILRTPSTQYPKLKGLLGGLVHLLEAIGGSYYGPKKFAGQNIFFSLAELRLHINQMITAYPDDPTAYNLIGAGYDSLFGRTLGGLGDQVSIRQALNALMGMIFHETYAIPTPSYTPGTLGTVSGVLKKKVRGDSQLGFIAANADSIQDSLIDLKNSIESTESLNPEQLRQGVIRRIAAARDLCKETTQKARALKFDPAISLFSSAATVLGTALTKARFNWTPGNPSRAQSELIDRLSEADRFLERASKLEIALTPQKTAIPARLNSHIFRPDVWFSAPPRCNVLFPDQYIQLDYQRNFMREPTRLLLKTNDEFFGEDELFDQFYFAPKGFTVKSKRRDLSALLQNDLLDHELFTGILPVFEKMGELNIFAARNQSGDKTLKKVGLAQRSTNFLYFKYRFSARQMSVVGPFNPYVAPGFPGLIIDKYVDVAKIDEYNDMLAKFGKQPRELKSLLGSHFLGNFTEVVHSVDQGSAGRTTINCSYPREHNESVEFLGSIETSQEVKVRFGEDALRSTDVAALQKPALFSLGPNLGVIGRVVEVTDVYRSDDPDGASTLPLYRGPRRAGINEFQTKVPVGVTRAARDFGEEVVALAGDPDRFVTFKAYRIEERAPRYRKETIDLPAEEYIRPGWYGDIWHPNKIHKAYEHFFRTGAITDPIQIADPAGASLGQGDQDLQDALAQNAEGMPFDDPRGQAPAIIALDKNATIEQAVNFLLLTYSYIKQAGLDPDEFIKAYTWRPIASLPDLFGSSDLELSPDGTEVLQGIEGFHSRAFGDFSDLFGLVPAEIESILGIKSTSNAAQHADTRGRKYSAVQDYVTALAASRAILG